LYSCYIVFKAVDYMTVTMNRKKKISIKLSSCSFFIYCTEEYDSDLFVLWLKKISHFDTSRRRKRVGGGAGSRHRPSGRIAKHTKAPADVKTSPLNQPFQWGPPGAGPPSPRWARWPPAAGRTSSVALVLCPA
jgi:hypothetical protein